MKIFKFYYVSLCTYDELIICINQFIYTNNTLTLFYRIHLFSDTIKLIIGFNFLHHNVMYKIWPNIAFYLNTKAISIIRNHIALNLILYCFLAKIQIILKQNCSVHKKMMYQLVIPEHQIFLKFPFHLRLFVIMVLNQFKPIYLNDSVEEHMDIRRLKFIMDIFMTVLMVLLEGCNYAIELYFIDASHSTFTNMD